METVHVIRHAKTYRASKPGTTYIQQPSYYIIQNISYHDERLAVDQ